MSVSVIMHHDLPITARCRPTLLARHGKSLLFSGIGLGFCCLIGGAQAGLYYSLIPGDPTLNPLQDTVPKPEREARNVLQGPTVTPTRQARQTEASTPTPIEYQLPPVDPVTSWVAPLMEDMNTGGMLLWVAGQTVILNQARIGWPDTRATTNIVGLMYRGYSNHTLPSDLLNLTPALTQHTPDPSGRDATKLALLNGSWSLMSQSGMRMNSRSNAPAGAASVSSYWLLEGLSPRMGATSFTPPQEYPRGEQAPPPTAIPEPGSLGLMILGLLLVLQRAILTPRSLRFT